MTNIDDPNHGPPFGEGTEVEYGRARYQEISRGRRLPGDALLALVGGLVVVAFVIGVSWRLLEAVL